MTLSERLIKVTERVIKQLPAFVSERECIQIIEVDIIDT
jgi:hypothetical protein